MTFLSFNVSRCAGILHMERKNISLVYHKTELHNCCNLLRNLAQNMFKLLKSTVMKMVFK